MLLKKQDRVYTVIRKEVTLDRDLNKENKLYSNLEKGPSRQREQNLFSSRGQSELGIHM